MILKDVEGVPVPQIWHKDREEFIFLPINDENEHAYKWNVEKDTLEVVKLKEREPFAFKKGISRKGE